MAKAIVLKKSDFPRGWKTQPHKETARSKKLDREFAACVGAPDPEVSNVVAVNGPDISNGPAFAGSSVAFVRKAADAKADLAAARSRKFGSCFKKFVREDLGRDLEKSLSGARLKSVSVRALKLPRSGGETVGQRVKIALTGRGRTVAVVVDFAFIIRKRAEVALFFGNVGAPFNSTAERQLLKTVARRLVLV